MIKECNYAWPRVKIITIFILGTQKPQVLSKAHPEAICIKIPNQVGHDDVSPSKIHRKKVRTA